MVVVHEWWGLNDYARERAKQLAELGYTAIAVDMYGTGKSTTHPKDATAFMNAALAEPEKMNARFDAALGILRKQSSVDGDKLFAIGYCFGGAVVHKSRRVVDWIWLGWRASTVHWVLKRKLNPAPLKQRC